MPPYSYTIGEIARWDARLLNHRADLSRVLVAADILRARRAIC
jgi:hypothetical protein